MMLLLLLVWAVAVKAFHNSYQVKQERFEAEYYNPDLIDITAGVYKYNRTTNSVNITFTLKEELMDRDMCVVRGFKWMSNQYRLDILQFEETIKDVIGIKYFDMGRLFLNYTKPPLQWPLRKGVPYKMRDWVPDSSQFPPGMPEGKWKLSLQYNKADKTPITVVNWYVSIEYNVRVQDG